MVFTFYYLYKIQLKQLTFGDVYGSLAMEMKMNMSNGNENQHSGTLY